MSQPTDDAPPPRPIDAYLASVAELWPGTGSPTVRRGGSAPASAYDGFELLVLPRAGSPRLLVPAHNRTAAARGMLRFSAALSAREIVQRLGVAVLLRSAPGRVFPDRIRAEESAGSLRAHLGDLLGEPVDLTLGLGTARVNRKPVLQVFDRRGRSIAFAKLGESSSTRALVSGEAATLRRLAGAGLPRALEVPALLHDGEWRGHSLLVMSALPSSVRQRPRRQFDVPHEAMRLLHGAFAEDEVGVVDTPLWAGLQEQAAALDGAAGADRLRAALETVRARVGDEGVRPGGWHGDWTPWNMSRGRRRVQLWDWERFETGVPAGLDACHYGVNAILRRDGISTASVHSGLALAERSVPSGLGVAAPLYLATIAARYLLGTLDQRGQAIAPASQVVIEALETRLHG